MNSYLLDIKKTVDQLIAVGASVTTEEHIQAILDGLPADYTPLVTSIISRLDPYSIEEMEALLLAVEARIKRCHQLELSSQGFLNPLQANTVQSQGRCRGFHNGDSGRGCGHSGFRGRGRGRRGGRPPHGFNDFGQPQFGHKPQCQASVSGLQQVCSFNFGLLSSVYSPLSSSNFPTSRSLAATTISSILG